MLSQATSVILLLAASFNLGDCALISRPRPNHGGAVLTQQETHMSCRRVGYEMCKREYTWNVDKIWECINVASDVKNCGGCMRPMTDTDLLGQDCTMIPGQKDVRCIGGSCKVLTCHPGWQLHRNKKVCTEAFDEGD